MKKNHRIETDEIVLCKNCDEFIVKVRYPAHKGAHGDIWPEHMQWEHSVTGFNHCFRADVPGEDTMDRILALTPAWPREETDDL